MKQKIIFTRKISRSGQAKILLITIPMSIRHLVEFNKEYKITIEEMEAIIGTKESTELDTREHEFFFVEAKK